MTVIRPLRRSTAWAPARRMLSAAIAAALVSGTAAAATIQLNAGAIDTAAPSASTMRQPVGSFSGKRLHLVQFSGPIQPRWVDALKADGLQVVDYIPDYAYLVYGDQSALERLQSRAASPASSIAWDGAWRDEYKVHPAVWSGPKDAVLPLSERQAGGNRFALQLVGDAEANASTLAVLSTLGGRVFANPGSVRGFTNLNIELPPAALAALAAQPDVVSIHAYVEPELLDERQDMIVAGNLTGNAPTAGNYFDLLTAWGFTQAQFNTSGFIVDVTDDGADINPPGGLPANSVAGPVLPNHFVLYESGNRPIGAASPTGTSRFAYKGVFATPGTDAGLGNSGHGQLNMSIVGGYVPTGTVGGVNFAAAPHADASGFRYGLGVAPFVRLANSVVFDPSFRSPNFPTMLSANYGGGARVSTNSWGAPVGGTYTTDAQTYDGLVRDSQSGTAGNQQMVILFAAGNSGPGANTVGSPGTGKNMITVGASEGVQAFGGADGCGTGDGEADSANDIVGFSSRGPTDDSRFKPEIVGPGTHISGMAFVTPTSTGTGTAVATYRADGVCAGPGGSNWFPLSQVWYTASSGTSHSTPALAGGAALVYQQFINNPPYLANGRTPAGSAPPSPALTKAYLVNSARYMTGVSANDNLPSNSQGMGMMNLGFAFDGTPRAIRDQVPGDTFTGSGQVRGFTGTIVDNTKPFRVTLAWTDAPGTTTGNAFVNNLDLVVSAGGNSYLGNVFTGASSVTGGTADPRNNVESVFIPAGVSGPYTVTVRGVNVAGDGVPNSGTATDQDFALVAYNSGPMGGCPNIDVTPPTIPTGVVAGTPYPTQTFTAAGGATPYTFSSGGAIPPGMTVSGTTLSGTPTTGGTYNFSVLATDANGCQGLRDYTMQVISANVAQGLRTIATGNAILEPNECNDLTVVLNNTGTNAATAVTSTLSTTTPGVTVTVPDATYPDLAATNGTGTNTPAFQVSTDPTVACGSTVNFTQTVTFAGGGSPTTLNFAIPVGQLGGNYIFGTPGTGATLPAGATGPIAGSAVDDAVVNITVPAGFNFFAFGNEVTGGSVITASTNGNVQLVSTGGSRDWVNTALPAAGDTTRPFPTSATILFPFWDDLLLTTTGGGIYTNLVGTAPNRQFIIEWRGRLFAESGTAQTTNFGVVFNEGSSAFEYRYVQVPTATTGANGGSATVGVQAATTGTVFTQSSFNQPVVTPGRVLPATLPPPVCSPGPGTCSGQPADPIFSHGFESPPPMR
jgi:hypothetical protein